MEAIGGRRTGRGSEAFQARMLALDEMYFLCIVPSSGSKWLAGPSGESGLFQGLSGESGLFQFGFTQAEI